MLLDLDHLFFRVVHKLCLVARDDHVVDSNRDAGPRRIQEAQIFQLVQHRDRALLPEAEDAILHHLLHPFFLQQPVDIGHLFGQVIVEDRPAHRRLDELPLQRDRFRMGNVLVVVRCGQVNDFARVPQPDRTQQLHFARLQCEHYLFG